MRSSRGWAVILASALLSPPIAAAATRADVTLPDTVQVGGERMVLNGMGIREATVLSVDVYVAGLYLPRRSQDAREILRPELPKRLTMHFVREVERADVVEAFQKGFSRSAGGGEPALAARIRELCALMTDMHPGDELTLTYRPEHGTTVALGDEAKGLIAGADFGTALFGIFVGDAPPDEGLKRGLLGRR
jgi:hypothetical protein